MEGGRKAERIGGMQGSLLSFSDEVILSPNTRLPTVICVTIHWAVPLFNRCPLQQSYKSLSILSAGNFVNTQSRKLGHCCTAPKLNKTFSYSSENLFILTHLEKKGPYMRFVLNVLTSGGYRERFRWSLWKPAKAFVSRFKPNNLAKRIGFDVLKMQFCIRISPNKHTSPVKSLNTTTHLHLCIRKFTLHPLLHSLGFKPMTFSIASTMFT